MTSRLLLIATLGRRSPLGKPADHYRLRARVSGKWGGQDFHVRRILFHAQLRYYAAHQALLLQYQGTPQRGRRRRFSIAGLGNGTLQANQTIFLSSERTVISGSHIFMTAT